MMTLKCKMFATLLYTVLYLDYVLVLELLEIGVPTHLPLSIRAVLFCRWGLGPNDVVYSVKWYKDGKEFFRHVPKEDEPYKKFLLAGVYVEEFNSSGSNLILRPAVLNTAGRYRCEVSGERPQFPTVSKYADMVVVVLPSDGLSILGFESHYRVGDQVTAICSSGQANSAVELAWYINGELAPPFMVPQPAILEDGGATTNYGIKFIISEDLMGNLKLQCVATVASVYWKSVEKSVIVHENVEDSEEINLLKERTIIIPATNIKSGSQLMTRQSFSSVFFLFSVFCLCISLYIIAYIF